MNKPKNEEDTILRAFAGYFRFGGTDQPSLSLSSTEEHEGKEYVVLRNGGGVLAVYRIQNSGRLKRMKRWPTDIESV